MLLPALDARIVKDNAVIATAEVRKADLPYNLYAATYIVAVVRHPGAAHWSVATIFAV